MKTRISNSLAASLALSLACLPAAAQVAPTTSPAEMEPKGTEIVPVKVEPAPHTVTADYNQDKQVDFQDIAAFVTDFWMGLQTGELAADVDGNGRIEPQDMAEFINLWYPALLGIG